jgi:hypothetical protein
LSTVIRCRRDRLISDVSHCRRFCYQALSNLVCTFSSFINVRAKAKQTQCNSKAKATIKQSQKKTKAKQTQRNNKAKVKEEQSKAKPKQSKRRAKAKQKQS